MNLFIYNESKHGRTKYDENFMQNSFVVLMNTVGDNAKYISSEKCELTKLTGKSIKNRYVNNTRGIVTSKHPELANIMKTIGNLYLCVT